MKKLLLVFGLMLTMVSCNFTNNGGINVASEELDSLAVDTTLVDSLAVDTLVVDSVN